MSSSLNIAIKWEEGARGVPSISFPAPFLFISFSLFPSLLFFFALRLDGARSPAPHVVTQCRRWWVMLVIFMITYNSIRAGVSKGRWDSPAWTMIKFVVRLSQHLATKSYEQWCRYMGARDCVPLPLLPLQSRKVTKTWRKKNRMNQLPHPG